MLLSLQERVLEQQLRFYLMVNGILAGTVFACAVFLLYKVMKAIFQ